MPKEILKIVKPLDLISRIIDDMKNSCEGYGKQAIDLLFDELCKEYEIIRINGAICIKEVGE